MRRVRLTCSMKHDDPLVVGDKDAVMRLPDHAAAWAVAQGNAVYLEEPPKLGPTRAELEAEEHEVGTLKKLGEASSQTDDSPVKRALDDAPEPPKRPYGNAPKSAWVRYACEVDDKMTEERGEGMTKADLMSRYGERL